MAAAVLLSGSARADTVVMADLGSSGSRIYTIEVTKKKGDTCDVVRVLATKKDQFPAATKMSDEQIRAFGTALADLAQKKKLPLGVYATAGLRDDEGFQNVPGTVFFAKLAKDYGQMAQFQNFGVLAGHTEGHWAWKSVAHHLGKSDFAILEIGGASTQWASDGVESSAKSTMQGQNKLWTEKFEKDHVCDSPSKDAAGCYKKLLAEFKTFPGAGKGKKLSVYGTGTAWTKTIENVAGKTATAVTVKQLTDDATKKCNDTDKLTSQNGFAPKQTCFNKMHAAALAETVVGADGKILLAPPDADWTEGAALEAGGCK